VANSYGPTNQFTLRGIGNVVLNVNIDAAVTTNLDGVPIARPTSVSGLFYDLERVEVLKGPQGTLYGRNATGGAINVITQKPQFGEVSGYINAAYGNYDALNLNAAVNLPVGDEAAVRVAGTLSQHDGYYSDGSGDERTRAVRGTFRSKLSDSITLTVGGDYSLSTGVGSGATIFANRLDERIGIRDPRSAPVYASTLSFPTASFLSPLTAVDFQHNSQWGAYANLDIDTAIGTVTIQPAYRKTHLDFLSSAGSFYSRIDETDVQKTIEARLVSPKGQPLQYVLGAFYMQEDNKSNVGFNQQFFAAYGLFNPASKAKAAYARLTYSVTPQFRVSLAGRYTSDKRSSYQDIVNGLVVCPAAGNFSNPATYCFGTPSFPNGTTAPAAWRNPAGGYFPAVPWGPSGGLALITYGGAFQDQRTFNKFTWRAGVEYDIGQSSLLYATYETGFKAGGFFNAPVGFDASFGPETVGAFTVGAKNRFLDNRLQLNVEGFWWTYNDKQFSHIIPVPGGTTFATQNVGKARVRGFEIEALGKVASNTTLNLDIQYLDAKELSFEYDSLAALGAPTTGCSFPGTPTAGNYRVNCSGRRSVNSPEWTINAGIEQDIPLGNGANIKINAQTRYQSSVQTSYDFYAAGNQGGYVMSDIFLTYESPDKKYYVTGYVNNIEDTAAISYTQSQPRSSVPLLFRYSVTSPRTYGVRVGVKF
jgi:iron complex outermembrane recepter protein